MAPAPADGPLTSSTVPECSSAASQAITRPGPVLFRPLPGRSVERNVWPGVGNVDSDDNGARPDDDTHLDVATRPRIRIVCAVMDDELEKEEGAEDAEESYGISEKLEKADHEIRMSRKREDAAELGGGEVSTFKDDDGDGEDGEDSWQQVADFDKAPWTTLFVELEQVGVELPEPGELTDDEIGEVLERTVDALATKRVFLERTNHLSDRELYVHLFNEALHEETKMLPNDPNSAYHLDLIGGGSDKDNHIYLKYYADDAERDHWAREFPDEPLPDHVAPPRDRDQRLPRPDYEKD